MKLFSLVALLGVIFSIVVVWRFLEIIKWPVLISDVISAPSSILVAFPVAFLGVTVSLFFIFPSLVVWFYFSNWPDEVSNAQSKTIKVLYGIFGVVVLCFSFVYPLFVASLFVPFELVSYSMVGVVSLAPSIFDYLYRREKKVHRIKVFRGLRFLSIVLFFCFFSFALFPFGIFDKVVQAGVRMVGVFDPKPYQFVVVNKNLVGVFNGLFVRNNHEQSFDENSEYVFSAFKWFSFGTVLLLCKEAPVFDGKHDLSQPRICVAARSDDVRSIKGKS